MISLYEILTSGNIVQTTKIEKSPTWYSTYMKVCPSERVKVLTVQNACYTNVPSRKNVFIYVGGYNNVFIQKKKGFTLIQEQFLFIASLLQ